MIAVFNIHLTTKGKATPCAFPFVVCICFLFEIILPQVSLDFVIIELFPEIGTAKAPEKCYIFVTSILTLDGVCVRMEKRLFRGENIG